MPHSSTTSMLCASPTLSQRQVKRPLLLRKLLEDLTEDMGCNSSLSSYYAGYSSYYSGGGCPHSIIFVY
jgi:hypothetical protein